METEKRYLIIKSTDHRVSPVASWGRGELSAISNHGDTLAFHIKNGDQFGAKFNTEEAASAAHRIILGSPDGCMVNLSGELVDLIRYSVHCTGKESCGYRQNGNEPRRNLGLVREGPTPVGVLRIVAPPT